MIVRSCVVCLLAVLASGCHPGLNSHTLTMGRYLSPSASRGSASVASAAYRARSAGPTTAPGDLLETGVGLGEAGILVPVGERVRVGAVSSAAGAGPDLAVDLWRGSWLSLSLPAGVGVTWQRDELLGLMSHVGLLASVGPGPVRGFVGLRGHDVRSWGSTNSGGRRAFAAHVGAETGVGRLRILPELAYTRAWPIDGAARGAEQWLLAITLQLLRP